MPPLQYCVNGWFAAARWPGGVNGWFVVRGLAPSGNVPAAANAKKEGGILSDASFCAA